MGQRKARMVCMLHTILVQMGEKTWKKSDGIDK